jgi:Protein of unknown function (DUF3300)
MSNLRRLTAPALTAIWLINGAFAADTPPPAQSAKDSFPPEQIEQLVAPIALYPDASLAQILMASTYPLDIVQAARWQAKNRKLKAEALQKASDKQPWDPSVKALVFFPSVLTYMNDNLDWTQDLGDAVLGQQDEVMDAVQRLRREAEAAGTLKTTKEQRVERAGDTIIVQPADPEVVYVPSYTPATAYGQSAPPPTTYYPATYTTPVYVPPTTTVASSTTGNLVSFGVGALVGGLLTSAIIWDRNDYRGFYYGGRGYYGRPGYWGKPGYWNGGWRRPQNINVERTRNMNVGDVNVNRGIVGNEINRNQVKKWEHNPEHRGGVRYRNEQTRQKFAQTDRTNRIDRDVARGRDPRREKVANLQRPEARHIKRPDTRQAQRPDIKRPESRPAKTPASRDIQHPKSRKAKIHTPARTADRTAKPGFDRSTPQRPSSGAFKAQRSSASAFSPQRGGMDRTASRRGAASRRGGGAHLARGGGHGRRR